MYGSHTGGADGFSLNGRTRFTSGIGANLGKSVTRTPFRGTEPMGHGGGERCRVGGWRARVNHCDGPQYPRIVSNSGSCCVQQTLVKVSVKTTTGMLQDRFKGILHGAYPKTWVKSPLVDHSTHLKHVVGNEIGCPGVITTGEGSIEATLGCGPYSKDVPPSEAGTRVIAMTAHCVNPTNEQLPFPFRMTNVNGCSKTYLTWQDAQQAGLLSANYKG